MGQMFKDIIGGVHRRLAPDIVVTTIYPSELGRFGLQKAAQKAIKKTLERGVFFLLPSLSRVFASHTLPKQF